MLAFAEQAVGEKVEQDNQKKREKGVAKEQHNRHAKGNPKEDKTEHSPHKTPLFYGLIVLYAAERKRISHKRVYFLKRILYNIMRMHFYAYSTYNAGTDLCRSVTFP